MELLLTLAIPRSDVKQPAKELIRRFGDRAWLMGVGLDTRHRLPLTSCTPRVSSPGSSLWAEHLSLIIAHSTATPGHPMEESTCR